MVLVDTDVRSIATLIDARSFLDNHLLVKHGLRTLLSANIHQGEALVLLRCAHLIVSKLCRCLSDIA